MRNQLHKVTLFFPAVRAGEQAFSRQIGVDLAGLLNALDAAELIRGVHRWLDENGRSADLVNIYDNTDEETGRGEVAVTLTGRDTALLLKLSLS